MVRGRPQGLGVTFSGTGRGAKIPWVEGEFQGLRVEF